MVEKPIDERSAIERDRALQPDPELNLSGGWASPVQIALTFLGSAAIIGLVIYGLTQQPGENQTAVAPSPAPAAGPPASEGQPAPQQAAQGEQNRNVPQSSQQTATQQPGQDPANPQPERGTAAQGQPGQAQSGQSPGGAGDQRNTGSAGSVERQSGGAERLNQ